MDIETRIENTWRRYAPIFDLDEDRYSRPEIRRKIGIPTYDTMNDTITLTTGLGNIGMDHETRHKVSADCPREYFNDAISSGNKKLLGMIEESISPKINNRHGDLARRLMNESPSLNGMGNEVATALLESKGHLYEESLAHSFAEDDLKTGRGILTSILLPVGFLVAGGYYASELIDKIGMNQMESAPMMQEGSYLNIMALLTILGSYTAIGKDYVRDIHRVLPNIDMLHRLKEMKPEIRKFHHLMKPSETADEFRSRIESSGIL